ncbi:hypothetical protein [Hugenholtzia roseola]|uniref:hypothetical protein n=1 Tax=Hugenholtzia roseola TaxID=1002 RepID=UPI0004120E7A|nr:hypothetical protein [Hugenholtzia roseola]
MMRLLPQFFTFRLARLLCLVGLLLLPLFLVSCQSHKPKYGKGKTMKRGKAIPCPMKDC